MNPTAVFFLAFASCVGYLISESLYGTVIGLTVALGLSILASLKQ